MPNLALTYDDLLSAIGQYLGYGPDSTAYIAADLSECQKMLQDGLRRFYGWRGDVNGIPFSGWSFLLGRGTVSLVASTSTYTLASDFADLQGPFTWPATYNYPTIEIVPESDIRELGQYHTSNGTPKWGCLLPGVVTGTAEQTWSVQFLPTPDTALTLTYQYVRNPLQVTSSATYPLGGATHAQAIKSCCLAEAETRMNDGADGLHSQRAEKFTADAARRDMRQGTPDSLGILPPARVWR